MSKNYYINGQQVPRPVKIQLGEKWCYSPSDSQIEQAGYVIEIIEDPIPEPPTQEEKYELRKTELKHNKYSIEAEIEILRQKDSKPEEYNEYYTYCEECEKQAYKEVYGKDAPKNLAPKQE